MCESRVQAIDRGNEAHYDLGVKVGPERDYQRGKVTEGRAVKLSRFPIFPGLGFEVYKNTHLSMSICT